MAGCFFLITIYFARAARRSSSTPSLSGETNLLATAPLTAIDARHGRPPGSMPAKTTRATVTGEICCSVQPSTISPVTDS